MQKSEKQTIYTCSEYRQEMILLGLQRRLQQKDLGEAERQQLQQDIAHLEEQMDMR